MFAIIKTGGKQYRVAPGDELKCEKMKGAVGDAVIFEQVMFTSHGEDTKVGRPFLEDSKVLGRITHQGRNRKLTVMKYKKRKGYRRKRGHRQPFTLVKIENIEA